MCYYSTVVHSRRRWAIPATYVVYAVGMTLLAAGVAILTYGIMKYLSGPEGMDDAEFAAGTTALSIALVGGVSVGLPNAAISAIIWWQHLIHYAGHLAG